ncbi:MAG: alpha/beta hydrolase [Planctomycetota bacterium]|nr:alpha/beta hydrolase [Planctomycetota bacterium]
MSTLLIVLVSLAAVGWLYERWARARDRRNFAAPGRMIDVGGHGLHVRSAGEGDLPVVFESDEGAWSTHWGRLPEDVSSVTHSIAYDRAGLGWSEPGPPPRDAETVARELHQLLTRIAPGRPVVLVGHGTAAHSLRAYAHRYPFETAGLVLVDPLHDGFIDRLQREQIPTAAPSPTLMRIGSICASFGLLRLLHAGRSTNAALRVSERQRATLDALELDPRVRRGAADEIVAEAESLEYLGRLNESMDIPVRVITSTETLTGTELPADFPVADYNRIWVEESERFLEVSKRAQHQLVEGSGHQLQLERPEVVLEAILDVVDEARRLEASREEESAADPIVAQPALEERA